MTEATESKSQREKWPGGLSRFNTTHHWNEILVDGRWVRLTCSDCGLHPASCQQVCNRDVRGKLRERGNDMLMRGKIAQWTLVNVLWVDSSGASGWECVESKKKPKPLVCETIGWVVRHTGHVLEIASTCTRDREQVHGCFTIPVRAIKEIARLSEPKTTGEGE